MSDDIEIYAGENWETAHVPVAWVHDVLDRLEITLNTTTDKGASQRLKASCKLVGELKTKMQTAQNELGVALAANAGTGDAIVAFWDKCETLENLCNIDNGSAAQNIDKAAKNIASLRDLVTKIDS